MLEGILLSGSSPGVDWHIVRFLNCSYKSDFVEQELPQHSNTSFGGEEGVGSAISGSTEYYTKIHQNSSSRIQGQQISAEGSGHSAVGRGDSAVGRGRSAVGSGSSAVGSGRSAMGKGSSVAGRGRSAVELLQVACRALAVHRL